tara:strand:- start:1466 stop:1723 length:258 start_codon:yes stop_codon:yes gene_type:complete
MSNVKVIGKVKCPFSKQDYEIIENLCETLIDTCSKFTQKHEDNLWVRITAHDITDVLIDLKVDLKEAGEKHGYADNIVNIGKKYE